MARIRININRRLTSNRETGSYRWILLYSDKDRELFRWLYEHVGPLTNSGSQLPVKGKGWMIAESYNEDEELDTYALRAMYPHYEPKGEFGTWLEIKDDSLAALLLLSGVLDDRPLTGRYC